MSPEKNARIAFVSAVALLLSGSVVTGFIVRSVLSVEGRVRHAYTVEVALGSVDASLAKAGRTRMVLINSDSGKSGDQALRDFEAATGEVRQSLDGVRILIADSASQQFLWNELNAVALQRLGILEKSVELQQKGASTVEAQDALTNQVAQTAFETAAAIDEMKHNEDDLLAQRSEVSERLLAGMLTALGAVLASSLILFWIHYRLFNLELRERRKAELAARNVSARLLRWQDDERRKISRELHDSLGQNLVAAKMVASGLARNPRSDGHAELIDLLEESVQETRTISLLLHPPLLDTLGLASAAKSLLDGFAQRTGLSIHADLPSNGKRLPSSIETVLFRVLQESLTNIHRHSKSSSAEVLLRQEREQVMLIVKDHGKGIPPATLERFRSGDPHFGIGLVGMRERVREQGGNMEISSDERGTAISATIPLRHGDGETADADVLPS